MMQAVAFLAKTQASSHELQHWWKNNNMTAVASSAAAFLTDILRMCGARTDPLSIITPHQFVAVYNLSLHICFPGSTDSTMV